MAETTGTPEGGSPATPASTVAGGGDPLSVISTPTSSPDAPPGSATVSDKVGAASAPPPGGEVGGHASDGHGDGHGDGGHGESAAQKGKAKLLALLALIKGRLSGARPDFRATLREIVGSIVAFPMLIIRGETSTRLLVVGFFASLALVLMTGQQILHKLAPTLFEHHAGRAKDDSIEDDAKRLQEASARLLFMEKFSGIFQTEAGSQRSNGFEFELYVEADQPSTALLLKAHLPKARESVVQVLQGRTYDELISEAGKNALKKDILDAVNRALSELHSHGSVKRVLFTKFVMN